MELSDSELAMELPRLVRTERASTVAVLKLLAELERRKLYAELGYSSLFDYCRRKLCYSEGASMRRIQAARSMQEHPDLEEKLLSGEVSLCTIATAASTLREGKLQVKDIAGHSKREVETLVAMTKPVAPPPERVRPIAVAAEPAPFLSESPPPVAKRVELKVSFSEEDFKLLSQARERFSNTLGSTITFEALIVKLAARVLKAPRVFKARGANRSRYVAQSVRHEVHTRDGGRCTYVAPDGTRCSACRYLQLDHIIPYGVGGGNDADNLRLRCPEHNRLGANAYYGAEKMAQYARG